MLLVVGDPGRIPRRSAEPGQGLLVLCGEPIVPGVLGIVSERDLLRVLPGTALERYQLGDQLLALVVVQSGGGGQDDRRSAWRSWSRDRTWEEVARGLGVSDLERLEITRRGPSGRVVGLRAVGRSGAEKEFEGFPIRRALDLPENLFSFHVRTAPDGTRTVRFLGRAWGHGVGLCQNGASVSPARE